LADIDREGGGLTGRLSPHSTEPLKDTRTVMVKRATLMLATILIALAVALGIALLDTNPGAQVALATLGGLAVWAIVILLSRNGDIWHFRAPYP
jgi:hypothetical protein